MRGVFVQDQRLRQTSLLSQPVIRLLGKIRHAPLLEKLRRQTFGCGFIGNVLRAVLTKLCMRTFPVRLGPGTAGTIKAAHLIELQQRARAAHRSHLSPGSLNSGNDRGQAAGDLADWFDFYGS